MLILKTFCSPLPPPKKIKAQLKTLVKKKSLVPNKNFWSFPEKLLVVKKKIGPEEIQCILLLHNKIYNS